MALQELLEARSARVAELQEEISKLKRDLQRLYKENRHVKRLAEAWMHDYDKLKAKYEPLVADLSESTP